MKSTTPRVLFVDDEVHERNTYRALLESTGRLQVTVQSPMERIGDNFDTADLYLIDYELGTISDTGKKPASYSGTTLLADFRTSAANFPLVLLTKESLIDPAGKENLLAQFPYIDEILYKSRLSTSSAASETIDLLLDLVQGYERLRQIATSGADWPGVLRALNGHDEESDTLRLANPPLSHVQARPAWSCARLADWIRHTLLAYPGVFYDAVYAATHLRISVSSFLSEPVQQVFRDAKYSGVFSTSSERWWKSRLDRIALEYVGDLDYADRFAAVFRDKEMHELAPAISIVRDEIPANSVCYLYHEPVMFKYTVAYYPDNRPPIMESARLSFKAIQQRNDVQLEFISGVDQALLRQIRGMVL